MQDSNHGAKIRYSIVLTFIWNLLSVGEMSYSDENVEIYTSLNSV